MRAHTNTLTHAKTHAQTHNTHTHETHTQLQHVAHQLTCIYSVFETSLGLLLGSMLLKMYFFVILILIDVQSVTG